MKMLIANILASQLLVASFSDVFFPVLLAANLQMIQRRPRQPPDDIHRELSREYLCAPIGARREFRVSHLPQIEVLAHQSPDRLDRRLQCRRIKDHRGWS
jgi:hypothetical protein